MLQLSKISISELPPIVQSLAADGNIGRILELALDIVNADRDKEQKSKDAFVNARSLIAGALPGPLAEAVKAIFNQKPQTSAWRRRSILKK